MEATENQNDGSIEAAVEAMINPELDAPEEIEEVAEEEESETSEEQEVEETDLEETDEEEDDTEDDGEEEIIAEDDSEADDADQESPELITVKVDGEEVEVTLDDLKQGYSGQKYVQKGMQENAAMRKQVEELYTHLMSERQQVSNLVQQLQGGQLVAKPTPPSSEMFDNDPIGYMEQKMKYDEQIAAYNSQQAQVQQIVAQQSEAQKRALEAYVAAERESLHKAIPELANKETAPQVYGKLVQGASDYYGYTAEEFGQVQDHRAVRVMSDALKYQAIMAGKSKAAKKVEKAKPVVKAGAKKSKPNVRSVQKKRIEKANRSGSVDDWAAAILDPNLR